MSRFFLLFALSTTLLRAQNSEIPTSYELQHSPNWIQKMYANNPNVYEVDSLYTSYYRSHTYVKNYYTQYYKRWRRNINDLIDENGFIQQQTPTEIQQNQENYLAKQTHAKSSNWSVVGPIHNTEGNGTLGSGQTNIYSFDQCQGQPNFLFLGTEPGEVYKSTDGGLNWSNTSLGENFGSGVTAIEVHKSNPQIVYAGGNYGIFKSINGGSNWVNVMPETNLNVNEIFINPGNDQIVFAATDKGLYRSVNGGTSWIQLYSQACYDIKSKPMNDGTMYLLKKNPTLIICEFYKSTDFGATWTLQTTGWYTSTDAARSVMGGRIAVSDADPNRVYAQTVELVGPYQMDQMEDLILLLI
jgi:hypothetical protein